jgi:hypothetical protein
MKWLIPFLHDEVLLSVVLVSLRRLALHQVAPRFRLRLR